MWDSPALLSSRSRCAFPPMATDVFNSKNLAVQAQKKILGKMVSKSIAITLNDDTSSEVLDELYRVTKEYTQNKKEAVRVIKNLIKTVLKLAILYRNNQFNQDELALMEKFKKKVHQLAMTVVSFHQMEYTFDRNVLSRLLNECRDLLHDIIQRHLIAKSHRPVNNVFDHFSDCDFLAALYNPFGKFKPHLQKLCNGISKMLDEETIMSSGYKRVTNGGLCRDQALLTHERKTENLLKITCISEKLGLIQPLDINGSTFVWLVVVEKNEKAY
ncbi:tumor necrosis factor alpha-induced protein 8 isoform X2 [Sigmodon hispidus]